MDFNSVGNTLPPPPPPVGNPPPPPVGTAPTTGETTPTTGTGTTTPTSPTTTQLPPPPPPPPGTGSSTLQMADKFTSISGLVGSGLGGGVGAIKSMGNLKLISQGMKGVEIPSGVDGESTNIGGGIGSKIKGAGMAAKGLGGSIATGAKYGAIIGGAVSALSNGFQVLSGKKTGGDAVGTFVADTATATLSGAGGALAGGTTALLLGSTLGGLPLTILVGAVGLAGAVGTQMLTQKAGLYDSIKNAVKGMFGAQ